MSGHTPKPWVIGTRKDGSRWLSMGDPVSGPHFQGDLHSSEADARLIAAAPDLLAAGRRVLNYAVLDTILADETRHDDSVFAIRLGDLRNLAAAIARAEDSHV